MKSQSKLTAFLLALFACGSLYSQNAKEKPVSSPQLLFGKFSLGSSNEATADEIIKSDSIYYMIAAGGTVPGKIISFNVSTIKDGLGISETVYGYRLSKKQKALISKVKPGDKLLIEKIVIKYPGKEKYASNAKIAFKVKP